MPTRVCSGALDFNPPTACDQLQPGPHRSLGVVLMGLRIAEVHEHAVAHVLRHEPAEALHGLGDAFLVRGNDLAQVFRVHAGRECRRTDKVREHHGDLSALCGVLGLRLDQRRLRRCLDGTHKLRNRRQHFSSMAEQDADLLKVLIGQVAEDRDINSVLGKTLGVLGHAEVFEPVRNLLHRGPTRSRGAFNPDVDLIAERRKVDRLRQKRLSTALQRLALRLRIAVGSDHDDRDVRSQPPSPWATVQGRSSPAY